MKVTFLSSFSSLFIVVSPKPLPAFFTEADCPAYVKNDFIKAIFPCHSESGEKYAHLCIVSFPGADCDAAFAAAAEGYERELEAQSGLSLEQDFVTI